jgi:hypothetical protein
MVVSKHGVFCIRNIRQYLYGTNYRGKKVQKFALTMPCGITETQTRIPVITGICIALPRNPTDLYNTEASFTVFFHKKSGSFNSKEQGPD